MYFISKYDEHNQKLSEAIEQALKTLGKRNVIKIGSKNNFVLIDTSDILYISKENNDRKCIIRTKNSEILINSNFCDIKKQVKENFIHSHRSCLVNPKYISAIDYNNLIITFKNGVTIANMISRNYKKGLQNLWN